MSSKKVIFPKAKFEHPETSKASNSGIFNEPKMQIHYSPKNININKDLPKFKPNAIYRHASEEEFKRFQGTTANNQSSTDNLVSAEEEYYQKKQTYSNNYLSNYKKGNPP